MRRGLITLLVFVFILLTTVFALHPNTTLGVVALLLGAGALTLLFWPVRAPVAKTTTVSGRHPQFVVRCGVCSNELVFDGNHYVSAREARESAAKDEEWIECGGRWICPKCWKDP